MTAARETEARTGQPKVAVVIGSGGLKSVAAIGAINVLQREGVPIDMAVGCSGGSLCATWLARGDGKDDDPVSRFVGSLRGMFERIDYRAIARAMVPRLAPFRPDFALLDHCRINAAVVEFAGNVQIDDLALPLHVVATRSQYAFYSLSHHAEVIPVIPAFDRRIGLTDFHEIPWLIRQGEIAAEREIPYLQRLLQLRPRQEPTTQ